MVHSRELQVDIHSHGQPLLRVLPQLHVLRPILRTIQSQPRRRLLSLPQQSATPKGNPGLTRWARGRWGGIYIELLQRGLPFRWRLRLYEHQQLLNQMAQQDQLRPQGKRSKGHRPPTHRNLYISPRSAGVARLHPHLPWPNHRKIKDLVERVQGRPQEICLHTGKIGGNEASHPCLSQVFGGVLSRARYELSHSGRQYQKVMLNERGVECSHPKNTSWNNYTKSQ